MYFSENGRVQCVVTPAALCTGDLCLDLLHIILSSYHLIRTIWPFWCLACDPEKMTSKGFLEVRGHLRTTHLSVALHITINMHFNSVHLYSPISQITNLP